MRQCLPILLLLRWHQVIYSQGIRFKGTFLLLICRRNSMRYIMREHSSWEVGKILWRWDRITDCPARQLIQDLRAIFRNEPLLIIHFNLIILSKMLLNRMYILKYNDMYRWILAIRFDWIIHFVINWVP